jgi:hypothetical protein
MTSFLADTDPHPPGREPLARPISVEVGLAGRRVAERTALAALDGDSIGQLRASHRLELAQPCARVGQILMREALPALPSPLGRLLPG